MDAFFASVEQLDRPELRGKPIAVGGGSERGVVAAASYEARKYGVRSAMSGAMARRLCADLIFVRGNFERYKEVSNLVHGIFYEFTDLVESLGLDEAYLDVTENKMGYKSAMFLAEQVRKRVFEVTGLTCSAGVSYCKFLAKTASDLNKPNGMAVILPEEGEAFLEKLAIEKFYGIGKATATKMRKYGIRNGADLKTKSRDYLTQRFGKVGRFYYDIVRGIDEREVRPHRSRKSIGAEDTFTRDLNHLEDLINELRHIAEILYGRVTRSSNPGRTLSLKVKYSDFTIITRSRTLDREIGNVEDMLAIVTPLLQDTEYETRAVRLLGLSISNLRKDEAERFFASRGRQLELDFEQDEQL